MSKTKLARWVRSLGHDVAARRLGVSSTTLARYLAGTTSPRGNRLALLERLVAAWEKKL